MVTAAATTLTAQARSFGGKREVDHHDGVLLDDTDEKNDADHGDDGKLSPEKHERDQRAYASGRQRRDDRQRMNQALVENAENDVDGEQRSQDENRLRGK